MNSKELTTVNKEEKALEVIRLRRKARLEAIEDYISFITTKVSGLALTTAGALELLNPEIIIAVLPQPASLMGIGFALLAGKSALKLLSKAINAMN